jgi:hypothetical protein
MDLTEDRKAEVNSGISWGAVSFGWQNPFAFGISSVCVISVANLMPSNDPSPKFLLKLQLLL